MTNQPQPQDLYPGQSDGLMAPPTGDIFAADRIPHQPNHPDFDEAEAMAHQINARLIAEAHICADVEAGLIIGTDEWVAARRAGQLSAQRSHS